MLSHESSEKSIPAEVLEKTLEDIFRVQRKDFFGSFDPQKSDFRDLFEGIAERSRRELALRRDGTDLLLETRKITVTPSGIVFDLKEKEMSNRILRKYQENLSRFLRVKFADDNLEEIRSMKYVVDRHFRRLMQVIL